MKGLTINLQLVKNLGNYETIRLGGEWSLDEGETEIDALQKANRIINEAFQLLKHHREGETAAANIPAQPTATTPTTATAKQVVKFGDATHQQIMNRLTKGDITDIEVIRQYYDFGEDEEKSFQFAITVYGKKEDKENK